MKFVKCLLFFFITSAVFSQKNSQLSSKEYALLQDKVRASANSNVDSAFVFVNRIEKSSDYSHKTFASGAKAYLYQLKEDSIKSKQYYEQAFKFLGKVKQSKEKRILNADLLNYGGLIDWRKNNLKAAFDKFEKGVTIAKKENDQIRMVKFYMNISLINIEVGNYKAAILSLKKSNEITDQLKYSFSEEKFTNYKSNINFNLGRAFEKAYGKNYSNPKFLDSAEHYYTKAILYSKNYLNTKLNSKMSLGNIYYMKNDLSNAEKVYYDVLLYSKENNLQPELFIASYNLGSLFFNIKDYDKSLYFFKKVDSIYQINKVNDLYYVNSNYYLAKIYTIKNNPQEALKYSEKYFDKFEQIQSKLDNEVQEVNFRLGNVNVRKDMEELQVKNQNKIRFWNLMVFLFVGVLLVLIVLYVKSIKKKRETDRKVNSLIEEYKLRLELNEALPESVNKDEAVTESIPKMAVKMNLDLEKEEEIYEKLKQLEKKHYYLNSDFTQQSVAKKIKTNTSYLSYVVNKRFGKTFSEYSNELKINYVINELITNSKYRKYSTQALAESVGFKNAISFTKSFSKRTGVTPTQFTKKLETTNF
ncbi:helix-turn-helix domain-containing protein [Flavobacterium sp. LS1R47]|uniref:Helix-turn-helix domain-containing protein n=1 Tax=Flavobacterium frigoritolerans TaxID=2987686 RepID=A0A9X3C8F0_9FLAO|nr:helix-turn-helix domain-containing protein [Flavobacterium frigoritolerans]MCV9933672.1 helix-turn-helix domain-containing protein [Flavobacterium frigoritolerans]